jgi:hypothetical protein
MSLQKYCCSHIVNTTVKIAVLACHTFDNSFSDDFVVPNMGSLGYLASGVTSTHEQDSHPDIDLDEFMDIVTIKCRSTHVPKLFAKIQLHNKPTKLNLEK